MRPTFFGIMASALISAGWYCQATTIRSVNTLFPADRPPVPSGATISVRVGPAVADTLLISPVTFLSRSGTNPGEGPKSMCGLVITAPGRQPQGVITVGTGVTEATPSCNAVLAVGAVPASTGAKVGRIGIIHAVSSRNAANGRAAVVLKRDSGGRWVVDEEATARADTIKRYTIAELRRRLK